MTEEEIFVNYLDSREQMTIVDGGNNFENRWIFASASVGNAPAAIADHGTLNIPLVLTGTLQVESRLPFYLGAGGT
jgi:hypothetical protein